MLNFRIQLPLISILSVLTDLTILAFCNYLHQILTRRLALTMVFFTCNSCGSCIKKPAVEKHIYQCRNFGSLSCMDCNKDFYGDEYKAHTKCVTELEKYSGEGWKAPAGHNKGEKKQGAWMDTVLATVEKAGKNAPPAVKSLLHALTRHDNVPRKKAKFLNFVKNIARNHFDNDTIESVWTLLEAQWKTEREAQTNNGKADSKNPPEASQPNGINGTEGDKATEIAGFTDETPSKKKKKHKKDRKPSQEAEDGGVGEPGEDPQFGESPKKKKHKKGRKPSQETEDGCVSEDPQVEESPKEKKNKGRKPSQEAEDGSIVEDPQVTQVEESPKKKKKNKGRKPSQEAEDGGVGEDLQVEESPKKKKRKKERN